MHVISPVRLVENLKKPKNPSFSSGPTAKFSGWNLDLLKDAAVGRSHRSVLGKEKLGLVIEKTKSILGIPSSYHVAIMPGSATGAMECALWSLLGPVGIDVWAFDVFSQLWLTDVVDQLALKDVRCPKVAEGHLPDTTLFDENRDLVFAWNGTTSGLCFPHADWIRNQGAGLVICDATSAAFCVNIPFEKLDVVAFSWQKGLGSEGGHGMLVLSPKAYERLQTYRPPWPMPRLFRLTKNHMVMDGVFRGETINTPSLLCVEDCLQSLLWAETLGGNKAMVAKCMENFHVLKTWVSQTPWVRFTAHDDEHQSPVSPCLVITPWEDYTHEKQRELLKSIITLLRTHGAAYDIMNHIYAKPSLRIWCGPTVDKQNLIDMLPWLTWAYEETNAIAQVFS